MEGNSKILKFRAKDESDTKYGKEFSIVRWI